MLLHKRITVLFFLLVFILNISAQDKGKTVALKTILITIEKQHQVSFNYTENNVATISIIPPKKTLSLKKKITYLEKRTKLFFENIDNKFINISDKNTTEPKIICGYILAGPENKPLEDVNIQFLDGTHTITNQVGYFEFKKEEKNDFLISYIGYKSKRITIPHLGNKDCLKILLESEITELSEIKTNHFLTTGISKSTNGSFDIKPKKLGILPGLIEPDVLQTMQQIPGINSIDESVASINVRGGTHDQNLFLWNGIKMYQTGHFFGLISAFNPNLAHTISIYKNGSSAFYGESVSSVIAISSNPNNFEKNSFSAGINMINADIYSKFNISKNSFIEIAARKSITDFVETPTYTEYYNKAFQNTSITDFAQNKNIGYSSDKKFGFYDITFKYYKKIGLKDHLILDLITINDKLNVFQTATINSTVQSENDVLSQKNYGGNLSWKRNWNNLNTTSINAYSSSYKLTAQKNITEGNQIVIQENTLLDNGIKIENNHLINSKFIFNNGYQFNEIGVTNLDEVNSPSFYRKIKDVLRTHAVILEGIFNDTLSKIYLNAGLRLNYIEKFKKYITEPRLQFNYGINKHLNLEILGEFKSQNSHQTIDLQKDYFGIEKRRWILSNNTTIPIQKSKQASISLSYSKNNWLLTFENFYKKVTGITSASQGFQNQLEFLKINGNYEVLGTEILLQKKINHFLTWFSYTYNNNNYNFPSFTPPFFSNNFEMNHVFSWAGIYEKNNIKIALGSKWYSGRPETTPMNTEINTSNPAINYNTPNNKNLSSFFQVNFSSTYKWETSKGIQYKLGLSILNVLNRKNEISEYYRISTLTNSIEEIKTFSLQRTPNLSFRASF
ncbi:TonB-dependent receptor [Flavobacterium sp. 83]|uniref:TonB-dependent receptor n=1 Tax=Flavobacterium sp. 83 TaxID=1131812 RepID=UPI000550FF9C|nr:TonB-dependent receptor [Flavobacterium sp. 83]